MAHHTPIFVECNGSPWTACQFSENVCFVSSHIHVTQKHYSLVSLVIQNHHGAAQATTEAMHRNAYMFPGPPDETPEPLTHG
jgi:hypothetical protein